jgi:hypothetical protein
LYAKELVHPKVKSADSYPTSWKSSLLITPSLL